MLRLGGVTFPTARRVPVVRPLLTLILQGQGLAHGDRTAVTWARVRGTHIIPFVGASVGFIAPLRRTDSCTVAGPARGLVMGRRDPSGEWPGYLASFHADNAGITEAVLDRCLDDDGATPYDWLAAGLPTDGVVVAVGCGSGPLHARVAGWVGLDASIEELAVASRLGRGPLVAGRAEALPIAAGVAPGVVAAMSLMVVADPVDAVREAARVLAPGGWFGVLLPAVGPLTARDRVRYGALLAVLGRGSLPFPHPRIGAGLTGLLTTHGFEVISDASARFRYQVGVPGAAERFVASLYLPNTSERRTRAAGVLARRWRGDLGVPFRRVVARRIH